MGVGLWSFWLAAAGNAKLVYYSLAVYSSVKLRWPAQISYVPAVPATSVNCNY